MNVKRPSPSFQVIQSSNPPLGFEVYRPPVINRVTGKVVAIGGFYKVNHVEQGSSTKSYRVSFLLVSL